MKGKPEGGGGKVNSTSAGGMYIGWRGMGTALPQPSFISNPSISFPVERIKKNIELKILDIYSYKQAMYEDIHLYTYNIKKTIVFYQIPFFVEEEKNYTYIKTFPNLVKRRHTV